MGRFIRTDGQDTGLSCRCLVIEDDPLDQKIMVRLLLSAGPAVEVEIADSISRARERLISGAYDLLLVDHHLPDGFGADFLTECAASGLLRWSRVYLFTVMPEHAAMQLRAPGCKTLLLDKENLTESAIRQIVASTMAGKGPAPDRSAAM